MKDLHTHLLFGIDDGAKTIEETISILKKLEKSGVKELVFTPHYINGTKYNCNNKEKEEILEKVKEEIKKEEINIKVYLGNEIFITSKILNLIKKNEIETINNGKYILIELPLESKYNRAEQVINEIVSHGYIPILAHPERYGMFQRHPNLIEEYLKSGILLQGNYTSLFGKYGKNAKKTLKLLLKKKYISFLGSDTHKEFEYDIKKLKKKLLKITKDEKYTEDILNNNFDKVIKNENIGMIR